MTVTERLEAFTTPAPTRLSGGLDRPPLSCSADEWLDFLAGCENRTTAIDGVIEDYPHVLNDIIWWAVSKHESLGRAAEQAATHLAEESTLADPVRKAFWTGYQQCADPFSSLPAPNPDHDYTWQPGDPF